MLKKRILCLVLVLCAAVVMTACQQKEVFPTTSQQSVEQPTPDPNDVQNLFGETPVPGDDLDYDQYDPSQEEGGDQEPTGVDEDDNVLPTAAPAAKSEYAGATPVLIDPIDKPTATPLPPLSFNFVKYEAAALRLSFEAPEGWIPDESQPDTYILTNPDVGMDYQGKLIIKKKPVDKNYNKNELIKEAKNLLDEIGKDGFKKFEKSQTAGRKFMNTDGIYANYKGTLMDDGAKKGANIAGRIIVACSNKTLYILHVSYPKGYANEYIESDKSSVYNRFRHSVKTINPSAN